MQPAMPCALDHKDAGAPKEARAPFGCRQKTNDNEAPTHHHQNTETGFAHKSQLHNTTQSLHRHNLPNMPELQLISLHNMIQPLHRHNLPYMPEHQLIT